MASQAFSHYRILKKIGSGGMGEVYLAEDQQLARKVAIKVLAPKLVGDERARRRLIREARAAAQLDHPNVCAVYEVGEASDCTYIVLQYVEGETLSNFLEHRRPSVTESLNIAIQILSALSEAHSHNIIHRDIKPQNIIITARGQVKVLDFGLAKTALQQSAAGPEASTQSILTEAGTIVGTAGYMSPEQARGAPLDERSDLFSFGAVLFECLTGRPAFTGHNQIDVCAQVIHVEPPSPSTLNPGVSRELDGVLAKALAKKVDDRYKSANEIRAVLDRLVSNLPSETGEQTQPLPTGQTAPVRTNLFSRFSTKLLASRPIPLVAASAVLVFAALLIFWQVVLRRPQGAGQPTPEAKRHYDAGSNALREGAYYKASKSLERAIALDDRYALAHARLAEAWTELDYSDKAKDELLRVTALVPDRSSLPSLDALYLQAITDTVMREFSSAIESYRAIVEESTELAKAHSYVDLGRAYEKNEDIVKAIENYERATNLDQEYAAAFLRLGIVRGRKEGFATADEALNRAETLYREQQNFEGVTEVLYQRGSLLNNMDKLHEARAQLDQALRITEHTTNDYQRIITLLQLSSVSATSGDLEQAPRYATEAIGLAQKRGIENLTTRGLVDLGNAFFVRGDYGEAGNYYKQALEYAQRNRGRRNEARAQLSLGSLHLQRGDIEEGIKYITNALAFYQQAGFRKETSLCLLLMGRARRQQGDYDAALEAFTQQLQLAEAVNDPSQVASSHSSIAHLLDNKEQYPEALDHFDESYQINKLHDAKGNAAYDLKSKADVLWQLGRYKEAEVALNEASSIASRQGNSYKQLLSEIRLVGARMALSKRRFDLARSKSREALEFTGTENRYVICGAKVILGLAGVLQGGAETKRQGLLLCQEAFEMSIQIGNLRSVAYMQLALAEAMLESGSSGDALRLALEAQRSFSRGTQPESEWRASLIVARASQRTGDESQTREHVSSAVKLLASLQQRWGPDNYNSYLRRQDVKGYRKQLDAMLRSK